MVNIDYLYNKEYALEKVGKEAFFESPLVDKKLSYQVIENGYILPCKSLTGGVVDSSGEEIKDTALYNGLKSSYDFNKDNAEKIDETVIYIGAFCNVWGHNITDCISRLWFILDKELFGKFKKIKLAFSPFDDFKWNDNFKSVLQLLDINVDELICVNEVTQFSNVIIPDRCFYKVSANKVCFTKEYQLLIDRIKDKVESSIEKKFEKIYFTCSHFSYRHLGERKLEKFFKKRGYTIVAPEEYSFFEQISMLKKCKHLVTTDGSVTHNSIFMNDNATLTIIPRATFLTEHQIALNKINNLYVNYVDSSLSIYIPLDDKLRWLGPFYYFVSENLLKYFGESDNPKSFWKKQLKDFKEYYIMAKSNSDFSERVAPEFYQEVAKYYLEKAGIKKMPKHFINIRNKFYALKRRLKIKFKKTFLKRKG